MDAVRASLGGIEHREVQAERRVSRGGARTPDGDVDTRVDTKLQRGREVVEANEPIADAVRSILDGHVVFSRGLAHAGHYPAVEVLASVSRLVGEVVDREVRSAGDDVGA